MKYLFSLGLAGLLAGPASAQSFEWVREQPTNFAGTPASEFEKLHDVAVAPGGQVAVAGFRASTSATSTWSVPYGELGLSAYDGSGNLLFSRQLVGSGQVVRLRADAGGRWLLLGVYLDSLRLSATTQLRATQPSLATRFVASYDAAGQLQWARSLDLTPAQTFTTDAAGNLLLGYSDELDNSYVVRLAANGQGALQPVLTQAQVRHISSLDLDAQGRLLVAGACPKPRSTFGDLPVTIPDDYHFYVAAYDATGHCLWANPVREGVTCQEVRACWDGQGGAYLAASGGGYALGSLPVPPVGNPGLTCTLAHLAAGGRWDWVRQSPNLDPNALGMMGVAAVNSLSVDAAGNAYWAGYLRGGLIWGPGSANSLSAPGFQNDALLLSYDRSGTLRWARSGGGGGDHYLQAVAHAPSGPDLYAVGMVNAAYTFGPLQSGQGVNQYTAVLLKLGSTVLATTPTGPPAASRWQLSPNPARGPVQVRFGAAVPTTIAVLDVVGRTVRTMPVPPAATETAVPTVGLAPGVYVLRATAGAVHYCSRLVVE